MLLLDWQMPEIDGLEMLRRAEADPAIRLPSVVLMVTVYARGDAERGSQGLRLDAILTKPATPSSLFDAVSRAFGIAAKENGPLTPSLIGRLSGLRVLLVEDNEINQQVARDILERAGASVEVVGDGRMAGWQCRCWKRPRPVSTWW